MGDFLISLIDLHSCTSLGEILHALVTGNSAIIYVHSYPLEGNLIHMYTNTCDVNLPECCP